MLEEFEGLHARMRAVVKDLDEIALNGVPAEGENSIAALITHTLGSEKGWLHRAAGRPFKRDRKAEFRAKASAADLASALDATEPLVKDLLLATEEAGYRTTLTLDDGRKITVAYCVTHALTHAAEHVGHAELTRDLLGHRVDPTTSGR